MSNAVKTVMKNVKSFLFVNVGNSVFSQCKRDLSMIDMLQIQRHFLYYPEMML